MKVATGFKFNLPFEYWTAVVTNNNGDNVLTYVKDSDRVGMIVQGGGGINLIVENALSIGTQVRHLRDRDGNEIFVTNGVAYPVYVTGSDPQFDPFMRIVGYKHRLERTMPKSVQTVLDSLQASIDAQGSFVQSAIEALT